ncbi:NAD(P)-dependent oxidoreductase [Nonomuraea wenchangensis]|uniref:NAD(P)-dependent oxidoreductase n=1 Tax=Nonomuraea wenchangensis TaxID=568860 RepID=UPI00371946A5
MSELDHLVRTRMLPGACRFGMTRVWRGRVFGLLSFGAIARLIAERARAFGVEVWAHDPFLDESEIRAHPVRPVSFDRLVEGADFLVIQAPLTPETHHAFDRTTLRRMKPTAVLINTGRGPIVEDAALYQALAEGWIAGAALDDLEDEPAKQRDWRPRNPLFTLPNVIITQRRDGRGFRVRATPEPGLNVPEGAVACGVPSCWDAG